MKTLQKKVKFSKGILHEDLIERSDLEAYDSSASLISNCVSTVYGGLRSRQGTRQIASIMAALSYEEVAVTPTSTLGGNISDLATLTPYESATIHQNRILAVYDLGTVRDDIFALDIAKLSLAETVLYEQTGTHTSSLSLLSGRYEVTAVGGGGGAIKRTNSLMASGGGGAAFQGNLLIPSGIYTLQVGGAGANGNSSATPGEDTCLDDLITACGGTSGQIQAGKSIPGQGGILSCGTLTEEPILSKNGENGEKAKGNFGKMTAVGGAASYLSYGAGGTISNNPASCIEPTDGYLKIEYAGSLEMGVYASVDGITYQQVSTFQISRNGISTQVIIDAKTLGGVQFIKLQLESDLALDYPYKIACHYIKLFQCQAGAEETRPYLRKFVFNQDQSYLLVLAPELIYVFYHGVLEALVTATGLEKAYLSTLHTAQSEDTMIFTHPEMPPKQLQRTSLGWVWGDFPLKNIPYYAFGGETVTDKTSTLTPSGVEGQITISSSSHDFTSDSVGQYIDGGGGRIKITEYISDTKVAGYTIIPLYSSATFNAWKYITGYEAVWSAQRGWPRACLFAQQRLWFGGSYSCPSSLWASRINLYNDFKNVGSYDNDAIHADMVTNDPILHLIENRGIHIFTTASEWSAAENALTPSTFGVVKNTQNGSLETLSPCVLGGEVIFVEKNGKSVLGYVYNYNQAAYTTDNLSLLSCLMQQPIALDTISNSEKDRGDFIYTVLEDGRLLITCLVLNQHINSTTFCTTQGSFIDVCTLGQETYVLVKRQNGYYVEVVDEVLGDSMRLIPVLGNVMTGLEIFEGQEVIAYDSTQRLLGLGTVIEGELVLEQAVQGELWTGLAFDYQIVSNPLVVQGQSFSLKKKIATATIYTQGTQYLTFCGQTKYQDNEETFHFYGVSPYAEKVVFTISGRFYPIKILSLVLDINYA